MKIYFNLEILHLEALFHEKKLNIALKYYELLLETYDPRKNQDLKKQLIELVSTRPIFDFKKNSIFETYHQEIQNLEIRAEMLSEIIKFQKFKESEVVKTFRTVKDLNEKINFQLTETKILDGMRLKFIFTEFFFFSNINIYF